MATAKEAIKAAEASGTKISKDKLIEAIKKTNEREFPFTSDGKHAVVRVPLG
jgi:hypothetical protein